MLLGCAALLLLTGCDEGRIYEDVVEDVREGGRVRLTGTLSGTDTWSQDYNVVLAGFRSDSEYALISKNVQPDADGTCDMELTGIPSDVETVELCVVDRLRRKVASFATTPCDATGSGIIEDVNVDVSQAEAVQQEVFNTTCVNCHGGSSFAAGGLDLTKGHAFVNLVNAGSVKEPGLMRVRPGEADNSVLWRILSTDESASWKYDHSVEVVNQVRLELIRDWIENGAKY